MSLKAAAAPASARSMLPGFTQLLRKELIEARRSKRLIAFVLVMTLALLTIVLSVGGVARNETLNDGFRRTDEEVINAMLGTWAGIIAYLGSFMIIAVTIDPVTRERSLGITAWIITKPVSRLSYLSAIAAGHIITGVAAIVILPSIPVLLITAAWFQQLPIDQVGAGLLVLAVEVAFLTALNVGLGVVFRSVPPVLMCSLAVWFLPTILPAFAGLRWLFYVLPSYLPVAAIVGAGGVDEWMVVSVPAFSLGLGALVFWIAAELFEGQEL
jgi:ABC-type transport system involved in multi-copper enzyme maturation permease subunit